MAIQAYFIKYLNKYWYLRCNQIKHNTPKFDRKIRTQFMAVKYTGKFRI